MLLMEFAPVTSTILYLLNTLVRMPSTSLCREGILKELELRFPLYGFVFYSTILRVCPVLNVLIRNFVYF